MIIILKTKWLSSMRTVAPKLDNNHLPNGYSRPKRKYTKGWINCPIFCKRTVIPMCRRLWQPTENLKPL